MRIFIWILVIVFSWLIMVAFGMSFGVITYRMFYRTQVHEDLYRVLDKEKVLLMQHAHKGVPLGGGV